MNSISKTVGSRPTRRSVREHGATMLEFAILLPVFCLLIFGFFDIARYWQAKAALQEASWQGLNRLVIDPGLKKPGTTDYTNAINNTTSYITQRAADLCLAAGGNTSAIKVTPPSIPSDLKQAPIVVETSAHFVGTFLPIDVYVSSKIAGYAESLRTTSEPLVTDCSGHLYDATSPAGTYPYGNYCPCANGTGSSTSSVTYTWNGSGYTPSYSNSCICGNYATYMGASTQTTMQGTGASQSCGCPSGQVPVPGFDYNKFGGAELLNISTDLAQGYENLFMFCCPAGTPPTCPGNQSHFVNGSFSCGCGCTTGATAGADGNCSCNNPIQSYTSNGSSGTCTCPSKPTSCPIDSDWDSSACACLCIADHSVPGPTGCPPACSNPFQKFYSYGLGAGGSCYCNNNGNSQGVTCPGLKFWNNSACNCTCPSGMVDDGSGGCKCDTGRTWNSGTNSCACDSLPSSCSDSKMTIDPNTCGCVCPSGSTNSSGVCSCGAGKQFNGSNACVCTADASSCSDSKMTIDPNSCQCTCPAGSAPNAGVCACSNSGSGNTKHFAAGNACVCDKTAASCPAGTHLDANSCDCICDDPAKELKSNTMCCYPTQILQGGACACQSPRTLQGTTCGCPACSHGFTPDSSCGCSTNCSTGNIVNQGANSYCSPVSCNASCNIAADGSCDPSVDCFSG